MSLDFVILVCLFGTSLLLFFCFCVVCFVGCTGLRLRLSFLFCEYTLLDVCCSGVLVPADAVSTESLRDASKGEGCLPIQKAGVWHSMKTFFGTDLAMLAYDVVTDVEVDDEETTSFLASK